jgi:hypothetical protein
MAANALRPKVLLESSSARLLLELACEGHAHTVLPYSAASVFISQGRWSPNHRLGQPLQSDPQHAANGNRCCSWQPGLDRGREGVSLPSLRTVRAVLPHTALQSVRSSSGLAR